MKKQISGIHHITAICGEPQRNVDFYAGVLGLRLVKRTVNFDDPKTRTSRRTVPLSPKAIEILAKLKVDALDSEALVFRTERATPLCRRNLANRQLAPTCKALRLERISWHSLRHANATLLDSVNTPLGTLQALLGHSSPPPLLRLARLQL